MRSALTGSLLVAFLLGLAAAAIAVTGPLEHRFAETRVGETAAATLTYETAREPSDPGEPVTAVEVVGADASAFTVTRETCTARPVTAACTVRVAFAPSRSGEHAATLRVVADDGTVETALTGRGFTAAAVAASPTELRFAANQGALSDPMTATIVNAGDRSVRVADLRLEGPDAAAFFTSGDACSRAVLAPGEACAVGVRFRASFGGAHAATLVATTDAGEVRVGLSGTGTAVLASPAVAAGWREFGIVRARGRGGRVRVQLYSERNANVRFAVWRRGRRVAAQTKAVPAGLRWVTLQRRFRPGTYLVRVAARRGNDVRRDGEQLKVRR